MNEVTIPYHLLFPAIICVIGICVILFFRKKLFSKYKLFWTSVIVFFGLYLLIVCDATYMDIYYQIDLYRYDLDKDGFFAGQELTEGQANAMRKLTNDVGRNLSFITGFVFAFIISLTVFILGSILLKIKKQITKKHIRN